MSAVIRPFRIDDTEAVVTLWREAGLTRPWNDPYRDIERKLTEQPEFFLVATVDDAVAGTVMAGWDGHRGWMSYLATSDAQRGTGIGRALVAAAEHALEAAGCPKIMLMVRSDNDAVIGFYNALGYGTDEVRVMGKRLIPDA
ncbi:GNAT family acetyltransferase [Microbacterium gorillae]|uniref:GNAT family acetyltransferase n=1 Tax=Microbacterium gorillae TaxID=1231063 RepID=UPI00058F1152|nr:GNAT family acetyltransferase [Microbacterium gorillae]